jgi:hypothetical protein
MFNHICEKLSSIKNIILTLPNYHGMLFFTFFYGATCFRRNCWPEYHIENLEYAAKKKPYIKSMEAHSCIRVASDTKCDYKTL